MDTNTGAINGIKPLRLLQPGEGIEFSGGGSQPYVVKRLKGRDEYACTCASYKYGPIIGTRGRTCKHLKEALGQAYDEERLRLMAKTPSLTRAPASSKPVSLKAPPLSPYTATKPGPGKRVLDTPQDVASRKRPQRVTTTPKNYAMNAMVANPKERAKLMLAHSWDLKGAQSPEGMWASEKLDGVRAHWDGERLWSRVGNEFLPPFWWKRRLPRDVELDGELFTRRDHFDTISGWVRAGASENWKTISFVVFDVVDLSKPLEKRWEIARSKCVDGEMTVDEIIGKWGSQVAFLAQTRIKSRTHLEEMLAKVEAIGGEGLMLRRPESHYKEGRSHDLFKVKTFYDAEAIVIGHKPGEGRNKGRTGALRLLMACGKAFDCGTGLMDSVREEPPKLGSIVVYAFQELSHEGTPRFPSYKGVAFDKTRPRDALVRSLALRVAADGLPSSAGSSEGLGARQ